MTVVSLGDAGTRVPNFLSKSRKARLGWAIACACCGSAAEAVTRSMAALGHTQTLRPRSAKTPVSPRKISIVSRMSMSLNLDVDDLPHDQVADRLKTDGGAGHLIAHRILDEKFDIFPIGVEHQERACDRNARQRSGRDLAVRADGLDPAAQLESLPNQDRQFVQQLGKVAAGAFLQKHGGNKEMHFEQRHALGKV